MARAPSSTSTRSGTTSGSLKKRRRNRAGHGRRQGDGYGHGAAEVARAALDAGASEIGVATVPEALALRSAGVTAPVLAWLHTPSTDFESALDADIMLGVSSLDQLAGRAGRCQQARNSGKVDLKIDTGLNRNGCAAADWPAFFAAASARAAASGELRVRGLFSHLACADDPGSATTDRQLASFRDGTRRCSNRTASCRRCVTSPTPLRPSPGRTPTSTWCARASRSTASPPSPGSDFGLRPALSLVAPVALVKRIGAGEGVSYGHTWTAPRDTTIALIPLGYADGIPRALSGRFDVAIGGTRYPAVGRVCMDQFLVDLGERGGAGEAPGTTPSSWAQGTDGLTEWAERLGTIHYELATGIRGRVERVYL